MIMIMSEPEWEALKRQGAAEERRGTPVEPQDVPAKRTGESWREYRERLERELVNARRNLVAWREQDRRGTGPTPLSFRVAMGDEEVLIRRLQGALDALKHRPTTEQEDP